MVVGPNPRVRSIIRDTGVGGSIYPRTIEYVRGGSEMAGKEGEVSQIWYGSIYLHSKARKKSLVRINRLGWGDEPPG